MYYYLMGTLAKLDLTFAVIDCGGVGYKLTVSGTTYESLAKKYADNASPSVKLFTHLAVREDDMELFGFYTETELAAFRMLLSVSGVGPKAAISILSIFSPEKFALAVCSNDAKAIAKANGVGAKTAARIILELHDKIQKQLGTVSTSTITPSISDGISTQIADKGKLAEAQDALMVLGYSRSEASNALKTVDVINLDLEGIIKAALKNLMKM